MSPSSYRDNKDCGCKSWLVEANKDGKSNGRKDHRIDILCLPFAPFKWIWICMYIAEYEKDFGILPKHAIGDFF